MKYVDFLVDQRLLKILQAGIITVVILSCNDPSLVRLSANPTSLDNALASCFDRIFECWAIYPAIDDGAAISSVSRWSPPGVASNRRKNMTLNSLQAQHQPQTRVDLRHSSSGQRTDPSREIGAFDTEKLRYVDH